MKKILTISLIASALAFNATYAQVSAKKDITIDEVYKELNRLSQLTGDESKAGLLKEAIALEKSKKEDFVSLAARVYANIDQADKAELINNSIVKKFPKGIKARQEAYDKIFNDDANSKDAAKQYASWLKKFPASSFSKENQGLFDQAMSSMAYLYFKDGNTAAANDLVQKLKLSDNFTTYASTLSSSLIEDKKYTEALPILEEAYNRSSEAINSTDKNISSSNTARRFYSLTPLYATALLETNNSSKVSSIMEALASKSPTSIASPKNALLLSKALTNQQLDLNAFLTLENSLIKNGQNKEIIAEIEPLYKKLNNGKGNFQEYVSNIDTKIKEALTSKYKSEMIKKEAPSFSLLNMKGETVSLADMKGKVVILDFWATWCGPCVNSFPGMQAAVNKYKDDKEVEFLFIDTWQREENYKEIVEKFITDKKYTFHVLFDEMKDRSKAITTAYGVNGIPHKVVIDKEGFIRFESSGSGSDIQKIVDELDVKIELAKKG